MSKLKQPVSYYGGKQGMLKHILPRIPPHKIYIESFFGGGSVFFAKEQVEHEIINDSNNLVTNFYDQCKNNFKQLKHKVEGTLFSRASYSVALAIWKMPHLFSELQQAWAFYVGCNQGFASGIGSWGFDKYGKRPKSFINKKMRFDDSIAKRLEATTIESNRACKVIKTYDSDDSFHYIDPPYINSHCRHYDGYSEQDYLELLDTLSEIEGKFLLSSYPSKTLDEYIKKNGWYSVKFEKNLSAKKVAEGESRSKKTEVLTANYPIDASLKL